MTSFDLSLLPTKPGAAQLRMARDAGTVARYAEAYANGVAMPPIVVFHEGEHGDGPYHLADGHHRVAAARKAGLTALEADLRQGDRRAAILHAAGANGTHGLPTTTEDKWNIVSVLLQDDEWKTWSDRQIATHAHVSPNFVKKVRAKTGATASVRVGKDGITRPLPSKPTAAIAQDLTIVPARVSALAEEMTRRKVAPTFASPAKVRIVAALYLAHRGLLGASATLSRDQLATAIGLPPDVHPGQLSAAGRIQRVDDGTYRLFPADTAHWNDDHLQLDEDLLPCLTPVGVGPGMPPAPASEPEELTTDDLTTPAAPPAPAPPPPRKAKGDRRPLGERRADWMRKTLAERIEGSRRFLGSQDECAALILLVGIDTESDRVWSEATVTGAAMALHTALALHTAHAVYAGESHRLPEWRTLAALFEVAYDELTILAERAIPE
jgi:hypothetical protein